MVVRAPKAFLASASAILGILLYGPILGADYLGLTIHTVSRTFSQLQSEGRIQLASLRQAQGRIDPSAAE